MDYTAISSGFGALKAIKDLSEALIGLRDAAALQEKRLEIQNKLLAAQQSMFAIDAERTALVEQVREAKAHVARLEAWEGVKKRYQLHERVPGIFTYLLKPEMAGGEPPHEACARCYQHGNRFILQSIWRRSIKLLVCPECKTELPVGSAPPAMPRQASVVRSPWLSR